MKTKQDIQKVFGVSNATVNNWIKTKMIPTPHPNGLYSENIFQEIKTIIDSHGSKLKYRANRKRNVEQHLHDDTIDNKESISVIEKIVLIHNETGNSIEATLLAVALTLLETRDLIKISNSSIELTSNNEKSNLFSSFLLTWLSSFDNSNFWNLHNRVKFEVESVTEVDLLGTVYQSLRTISEKSDAGAFFTPTALLENIVIEKHEKVIDPCCGSGRMLLNALSIEHDPDLIYARDVDVVALKICRVNFVLFYNSTSVAPHIEHRDFIFNSNQNSNELFTVKVVEKFDVVISNPPWGMKFDLDEKKILLNKYTVLKTTESFSIALYNSINLINETGRIYFILPESVLSVDAHFQIRKHFLKHTELQIIRRFGSAFKGVVSKVIRVDLYKKANRKGLLFAFNDKSELSIPENILRNDTMQIPIVHNQNEIEIIQKIFAKKKFSLQELGNCIFGIGIVTGNNASHLLTTSVDNSEPIYKGKDISPFIINNAESHIIFKPENFQQVAPSELYRRKKICYRFISDKVIMALDKNGALFLNSANFFIPNSEIPFEVIISIFNSSIINFFYRRIFNSFKLLRNHIEDFPIPELSKENIITLQELYTKGSKGSLDMYELDEYVGTLFGLNTEQINYIHKTLVKDDKERDIGNKEV